MLRVPYGISDFEMLRTSNYFYQDRTWFLEKMEDWVSPYLVFLRPRRFGKSLFVSVLHYYYGLEHQNKFQRLFGDLAVGQKTTPLANTYLVLRLEFSRINTATHESTYAGFLANVIDGANAFMSAYSNLFTEEQIQSVNSQQSPESVLKVLFRHINNLADGSKIYVLIDEYDQFANELLSFDLPRFKDNVSRNGFVRKFYETIKTGTGDGVVGRVFITGVSPITLDALTSGFNITDNISTNPVFHNLMGFTHAETLKMLEKAAIPAEKQGAIMSDLTDWYDGYKFAENVEERLFNPDMLLYFLKEYGINNSYPSVMLDVNIASDYRKIRSIFKIGGEETERLEILEELTEKGYIDFPLTRLYNLEDNFKDNDFLSLLYYMGMLTFQADLDFVWRFRIPNYVIKKLYFEYFAAIQLQKTQFAKSQRPITQTVMSMVNDA
jgi:hypothetical protein